MCLSKEMLSVYVGRTEVPGWDMVVAPIGDLCKWLTHRVAEAIPPDCAMG